MWFLYLLGCIIAIVIDYIIAKKFEEIAEMKGHEGRTYFWFTFIFGLVGMLMVIALPNAKAITIKTLPEKQPAPVSKNEVVAPAQKATHSWRCDNCGNMATQSPCEYCGK